MVECCATNDSFDLSVEATGSNINQQLVGMRFAVEPREKFRGRTLHEIIPMKENDAYGQPSQPRAPSYFADRNNHYYFQLLIPENYLSIPSVEYGLSVCLVTRDINGITYFNPYFNFLVDRYNRDAPVTDLMFLPLDVTQLKNYCEGIKEFKLRLVVVMRTNRELCDLPQPLPIFSSKNQNESAITTNYCTPETLKAAYHLRDVRFAVTLCTRSHGEEQFYPTDIQYISEVSTEDSKYRVRGIKNIGCQSKDITLSPVMDY